MPRVCIDYKDMENLHDESREAREMGFDGKQAIHPAQVDAIQYAFSPSEKGECACPSLTYAPADHCSAC